MTKLVFLGTKGEIEESAPKHKYHSSLLIISNEVKLLIDYGMLRKYSLEEIQPDAILITHAHPDHYAWLNEDVKTETPAYLTKQTADYGKFLPANTKIFKPDEEFEIEPFRCLPYRVIHSIRCPAVGYKIETPDRTLVYNSDLVAIVDKEKILEGVDYYIGDGSSIKANLVRRKGDQIFGHTRISTQVNWCQKYRISNIIFTHLGKETMEKEKEFGEENAEVILAYDGLELMI
ncbi:MAG: MBL fold metallo-hydrolase [Dehalococcoidales bacterium]